jgi:hypothetical protein
MTQRSKHLPYYVFLIGIFLLSLGFNIVQNQEIHILKQEKTMYRVFFEYLYDKLEAMEKEKLDKDLVYRKEGA